MEDFKEKELRRGLLAAAKAAEALNQPVCCSGQAG
jgi:hypothetical protein